MKNVYNMTTANQPLCIVYLHSYLGSMYVYYFFGSPNAAAASKIKQRYTYSKGCSKHLGRFAKSTRKVASL